MSGRARPSSVRSKSSKPRAGKPRASKTRKAEATTARAKPARRASPRKRAPKKAAPAEGGAGAAAAQAAGRLAAGGAVVAGRGAWATLKAVGTGALWLVRQRDAQRVLAAGVLIGAMLATSQLVKEQVESWPTYALSTSLGKEVAPPPGLSVAAAGDLRALGLPKHVTAFDERVVPAVAKRLARLPWVESVDDVRLEASGELRFGLRTHRPLARVGDGLVVSQSGTTLSARYADKAERLPEFVGLPHDGPARATALRSGARVLDDLGPLAAQVGVVDLRNLEGQVDPRESEIVLRLRTGLEVAWGRAGIDDRPCRRAKDKLEALIRFLKAFPQTARIERVSLRWEEVTYTLRTEELASRD